MDEVKILKDLVALLAWLILDRDRRNSLEYQAILETAEEMINELSPQLLISAKGDLDRFYREIKKRRRGHA